MNVVKCTHAHCNQRYTREALIYFIAGNDNNLKNELNTKTDAELVTYVNDPNHNVACVNGNKNNAVHPVQDHNIVAQLV